MPDTIARYQIIEPLGDGGMAFVYRAYDPHFQREVAIKVIAAHFMYNDQLRERFKQEAQVIAGLEHPAIVPVYDFGEQDGRPFLVMRLMPGGSLNDWRAKGQLPLSEVVDLLERLAPALDTAHRRGIVHRDIKPDNILFDEANHPYIADFGIAKLIEDTSLGLTQTGNPIGSPPYMSPEQARGLKQVDRRSDIYSLGVLLFEMLSGKRPYEADSLFGYINKHVNEPIPNICQINPTLPKACQNVILRALAKEPTQRYSSAGEMVAELKAIIHTQNSSTQSPKPSPPPSRLFSGVRGGLLILGILIILSLAADSLSRRFAPTSASSPTFAPTPASNPTFAPTPASTSNPNASSYIERGDALRNEGQYEQAIAEYTEAIRLDPNNTGAYFGRAFSHGKQGEFDLAIADYTNAIRLNPNYAVAYNNRGIAYRNQGQPDLAIGDYTEAIRLDRDYTDAYYNRGNVYSDQEKLNLAIADYDQAINLNPDYALAYRNRGNAYRKQEKLDLAIADYDDAIRINPDYAEAYNGRGITYRNKEELDLAIADYNDAIRINPDYAVAYYNRGNVYSDKEKLDLAIADYNDAIRIDPEYALAYRNRGNAYRKQEKLDLAITDYSEAIQINPDYADAYYNRGLAYEQKGERELAIADYRKALKLGSETARGNLERLGVEP